MNARTGAAPDFGRLLVCLPHPYQGTVLCISLSSAGMFRLRKSGGQVRISCDGQPTLFKWSSTGATDVEWVAFVGDFKYYPIKTGTQVILEYDLELAERVGGVLRNNLLSDPSKFLLYDRVRKMLETPGFMRDGMLPESLTLLHAN